jgi:predicted permease
MSRTVVLYAFGLSLLAALLSGALPAALSVRKLGWISAGATATRAPARTSRGLLVFQVAVSFVLVVGAGLTLDTMRALRGIRLGVDPERVLEATLDPTTQHYDDARARELYQDVLAAANGLPSVSVAALARWPVLGTAQSSGRARPEGTPRETPDALTVNVNVVSPGFLRAVGIELTEGRDFLPAEMYAVPGATGVALLSAAAAARLFPDGSAVGRRIDMGNTTPRILTVVGVMGDARLLSVKQGEGVWVFEPLGQRPVEWATLLLRGAKVRPTPRDVEAMMARVDPDIPLYDVQPLTTRVNQSLGLERVLARSTGLFAALALLLAGVGIYAVTTTAVQGRTRELGVRLALGADRASVRSMVLWDGVRVAVLGVLLGVLASTQLVDVLQRRLWGVQPLDPTVFMASAGTLIVAAALACWTPAWRATRIDPMRALRVE